jgi:hypothetical protein
LGFSFAAPRFAIWSSFGLTKPYPIAAIDLQRLDLAGTLYPGRLFSSFRPQLRSNPPGGKAMKYSALVNKSIAALQNSPRMSHWRRGLVPSRARLALHVCLCRRQRVPWCRRQMEVIQE